MTDRTVITSDRAPAIVGPYSHAIAASGLIFLSGQLPIDPKTNQMVFGDVRAHAVQCLTNAQAILEAAGSGLHRVVRTTVYLTDLATFDLVNAAYLEVFGEVDPPARAVVEVSALPRGVDVEIELIALA